MKSSGQNLDKRGLSYFCFWHIKITIYTHPADIVDVCNITSVPIRVTHQNKSEEEHTGERKWTAVNKSLK